MKKLFLLLLFAVFSLQQLQAQQTLVLANNGTISTINSGRAPQGSRLCNRSVYLITQSEMQASGFNFGDLISQIGFNYSNAQDIPTSSSTFELYLQNSFDATYSKTSVWDTAITDMTQVRNTNITIPAATGIFTIPFTGSSSFIYTGGSVYIAFDYQNLINSTSSSNRALCTTSLSSGIKTFVSNSTVGSNLTNSSLRPETYFTKGCTLVTPTFNTVAPIAAGASLSPLPTTSNNGITGTWSPALNNLTTTTYTFTPTYALLEGQCLTTTTMTITVIPMTPPGNALNFDGSNDYVSFSPGTSSATNFTTSSTFTIECWVNSNSTAQSSFIAHKRSGGPIGGYAMFLNYGATGTVAFEVYGDGFVATRNFDLGKWNHIALVYSSGTATFYINGIASGSKSIAISSATDALHLGIMPVTGNYGFNGSMDEVRIWNTARTPSQIKTNMLGTISASSSGLIAYYNFDNGTASGTNTGLTTLYDQTTNANNGTLTNFALTTALGATSNWVESYAMVVPTANAATSVGSTGFTASWTAPAVGSVDNLYVLSVSASPNFDPPTTNYQISPSATSFEITGLNPGTTYYYKVRADKTSVTGQGGFSSTITVCTSSTVTSASSSPTLCINSALTAITHTTAGATGIGTASNLPTGVTASWSNNTITISGTPSVSGTFNYSIPLTVGCGSAVNATGTIIVNPEVTPTFDAVAPITIGASLPVLPTISNNGITGTWSPDLDTNTIATTTYTFTPTAGQCATTTTMTISVLQPASSLNFSESVNTVDLGQSLCNFGTGDFAIEMKVKTNGTPYALTYLLSKRSFCDADNFLSMSFNSAGKIYVETFNYSIAQSYFTGNISITDNTWHQITLTRTGGYLKLYVDGVLDTTSVTNTAVDLNNNYNLVLGGNTPCTPYGNQYFNGNMDEVRFWNRSLTLGEIQNNMNCEVQNTGNGLLANYHFNQGNVNANNSGVATLTDSSGNNNTGTLVNFDLTGTTSNWSNDAAVTSGVACAPYFVQYTAIPDAQFESYLWNQGYDDIQGDGKVPTANISTITNLQISWWNISDLTGIQDFSSLITLKCRGNNLSTLNLSGLQNLTNIDCALNQLTSITLNNLQSLAIIEADNNYVLQNIDLIGLPSLSTLVIQNNALTSLNFNGAPNLTGINCGSNPLATLNVQSLTNLQVLYCALTQISSLNLVGLNALNTMVCIANPNLTCITVSNPAAAAANGNWQKDATANYSSNCGVVIPTSKVKANQCGATLNSLNANINADYVPNYQAYRFEVTNGATVNTVEVNKYNFSLTQTPGITYGTTYGVRVAVKMGGNWGAYGASCNVTTPALTANVIPTTTIMASYCGTTLTALDTKIAAVTVYSATGYRFEITKGGVTTIYDSAVYNFRLAYAGVAAYGSTYTIRVAALINGVYGNYGASCNVTTPTLVTNTVPTTTLQPSLCGTTLASKDSKITAVMVTGATNGRYEITKSGSAPIVYEVASTTFKLSQTGVVVAYNTAYAIRVAAFVGGVWGNYGASCTVTTPAAPVVRLKARSFEVSAYPNPFETAFNLNIETSSKEDVTIAVYDMIGKLLETHQVSPIDIANLQIGNNFSTGIYNVIVSQANEMKAIRLIRK